MVHYHRRVDKVLKVLPTPWKDRILLHATGIYRTQAHSLYTSSPKSTLLEYQFDDGHK